MSAKVAVCPWAATLSPGGGASPDSLLGRGVTLFPTGLSVCMYVCTDFGLSCVGHGHGHRWTLPRKFCINASTQCKNIDSLTHLLKILNYMLCNLHKEMLTLISVNHTFFQVEKTPSPSPPPTNTCLLGGRSVDS